jgi:hypothetical protein
MTSHNKITPVGVMRDIDPLSWRSITSQRRRLEQARQRQPPVAAKTSKPRPARRAFAAAIQHLINRYQPTNPGIPPPVTIDTDHYGACILWREQIETFAAYLTRTTPDGQRQARWIGTRPAQYPTTHSLTETLAAHGITIDLATSDQIRGYQQQIGDVIGPCRITGTRHPNGTHTLAAVTPKGQVQVLAPAPERDQRSHRFGPPPAHLTWGPNQPDGSVETARIILDYTDATTRTAKRLFHDAHELSTTTIQHWPPALTITVADIHHWTQNRTPITHANPAADDPAMTPKPDATHSPGNRATDPAHPVPGQRPPKRRPPIQHEL